jgi:Fe-S-cluster containining protein
MLNNIPMLVKYNNGHGVCVFLKDNLCTIYSKRPDICNINMMYSLYFKNIMSEEEFVVANLEACSKLLKISEKNTENV